MRLSDIENFWKDSKSYQPNETFSIEDVQAIEEKLGYKIPDSYIQLMSIKNGGHPKRKYHRTSESTSWAQDHIAITSLYSVGPRKTDSLWESQFWIEEWDYPNIGIYFADCPSAGHDMICLDYRECGPTGEPKVVHVDQESDYKITFVADSFEAFIMGLEDEEAFE